ncbi:phage tail tape measure protein [Streptosporangium sp. NPDC001559]|uniref:phage tail tape measure protein n=1 Tax=Streptosporangium sp. NPDC001559 TaxID=3366187 RepID=UPI0036E9ACF8
MALTVGELVAYAQLDKSDFTSGTRAIGQDLSKLQSSTTSSMASMESTVVRSLDEIEQAIRDGLDPTSAIRELDQLDKALDASFDEMLDEADQFAAELDAAIDAAFDELDDVAQQAGKRAGDQLVNSLQAGVRDVDRVGREAGEQLVDGLDDGLDEARRVARRRGEQSGEEFGDGAEDSGRPRVAAAGDGFMSTLKGLGWAAAGAVIGELLMSGFTSALDAEDAKAKLVAQLGATGKESEKLGKAAGELYVKAYGDSMDEVAEALGAVGSTLVDVGKVSQSTLQNTAARALDLSRIFDIDVNRSVASVGILIKTGMAKNASEAFDLITASLQRVPAAVREDLLDAADEYSVFFKGLGINGQEAFGILAKAAEGGTIQLDKAGDALKEFRIRSVDMSASSVAAYKTLGLNAEDMSKKILAGGPSAKKAFQQILDGILSIHDPVKREQVAVALFGTQFEDLGNIDALAALRPASNALDDVGGAAKRAGDALHDTASNRIEEFKRGISQNLTNFLGGEVLPAIEDFADKVGTGFEFSGALQKVQEFASQLGELWDSVVADVQEWVSQNKATIDEWGAKLQEGMSSVGETISDALAIAKELWDEYGDDVIATVTWLVDTFLSIWNGFWGTVSGAIKIAKGLLTGDMEEVKEGLRKIWDSLWQMAEDQVKRSIAAIKSSASKGWEDLRSDTVAVWNRMTKAINDGVQDAIKYVQGLPKKINTVFANVGNWLLQAGRDLINGMINGIRAKAGELADSARNVVNSAVTAAKNALGIHSPSKVFEEIGKWTVQGLVVGLTKEGTNAASTVEKMVEDIKKAFKGRPDVVDGLLDFVKGGNDSLAALAKQREELVAKLAAAKEYAKTVAGSAEEWASITGLKAEDITGAGDMASQLQSKASAINSFANDIQKLAKQGLNKKVLQDIIDAGVEKGASFAEMLVGSDGSEIKALNKAQAAVDKASKKLGKSSADALYDVGKKSGEGYLKGLQDSLKKLDAEMAKIAKALVSAIKKELKIKSPSQVMAEIGGYTVDGLIQGIQAREGAATETLTALVTKAVAGASAASTLGGDSVAKAAKASTTKIPIAGAVAGSNAGDYAVGKEAGGETGTYGNGKGVTINMHDTVVREDADINRIGDRVGFDFLKRGNI